MVSTELSGEPRSRRPKSPDAFRTIREVSDELDVPQHVLRFWETKFNQVRPLKRGGGRRYYRPEDVDLLRRIRILLYADGYTIRGVQKLLRESGGKMAPGEAQGAAIEAAIAVASGEIGGRAPGAGPELDQKTRARVESVAEELATLRDMLRGRVGATGRRRRLKTG